MVEAFATSAATAIATAVSVQAALDDLGLGPAIRALAVRTRQADLDARLSVQLADESEPALERLSQEVETAVYRVTQEALTNVRKHGSASHVSVDLWEDEASIHLTCRTTVAASTPT